MTEQERQKPKMLYFEPKRAQDWELVANYHAFEKEIEKKHQEQTAIIPPQVINNEQANDLLLSLIFDPTFVKESIENIGLRDQYILIQKALLRDDTQAQKENKETTKKYTEEMRGYLRSSHPAIKVLHELLSTSGERDDYATTAVLATFIVADSDQVEQTLEQYSGDVLILSSSIEKTVRGQNTLKNAMHDAITIYTESALINKNEIKVDTESEEERPQFTIVPAAVGAYSAIYSSGLLPESYRVLHDRGFIDGLTEQQRKLLIEKFENTHVNQTAALQNIQDDEENFPYRIVATSSQNGEARVLLNTVIQQELDTELTPEAAKDPSWQFKECVKQFHKTGKAFVIKNNLPQGINYIAVAAPEEAALVDIILVTDTAACAIQVDEEFNLQGVTANYSENITGLTNKIKNTITQEFYKPPSSPPPTDRKDSSAIDIERHQKWKIEGMGVPSRIREEIREDAQNRNETTGITGMQPFDHGDRLHITFYGENNDYALIVDTKTNIAYIRKQADILKLVEKINPVPEDLNASNKRKGK